MWQKCWVPVRKSLRLMCQAEEFKLFSVGSIVRWPGQSWDSQRVASSGSCVDTGLVADTEA